MTSGEMVGAGIKGHEAAPVPVVVVLIVVV